MNRKFILIFFVIVILSLTIISCSQLSEDKSVNSARSIENSANSIENSAKSIENSANSMAESAKSIANVIGKSNGNSAVSNTNSNNSNVNLTKSTPTPYRNSVEDNITSQRYAECVRQRTAAGLDTSPCSGWASER